MAQDPGLGSGILRRFGSRQQPLREIQALLGLGQLLLKTMPQMGTAKIRIRTACCIRVA
jgi:hypothetical protein